MSNQNFPLKDLLPILTILVALSGGWAVGKQDVKDLKVLTKDHERRLTEGDLKGVLYANHIKESNKKFEKFEKVEKQLDRSVLIQELIAEKLDISIPVKAE